MELAPVSPGLPLAAIGFEGVSETDNTRRRRLAPITIRLRWELRVGLKSGRERPLYGPEGLSEGFARTWLKQHQRDAGAPLAAELPLSAT